MEQIINELSFSCCYKDVSEARNGMSEFISVSRAVTALGFLNTLRGPSDFRDNLLAPSYSVYEWTLDKAVALEQRLYLLTHATKSPYIEELVSIEEENHELIFESSFQGEKALGLGLAYLWETHVLSLNGDIRFGEYIKVDNTFLESGQEVVTSGAEVLNLATTTSVTSNSDSLRYRLQKNIADGDQLWLERLKYFPHLVFCDNTQKQVLALSGNEKHFCEIVRHLFAIEEGIKSLKTGPLQLESVSYSTESDQTLNNKECKEARTIMCPDGQYRLFAMHTKIWSANQRIHYFPIPEEKIVYIGHIGEHLKTVNFKT